MVEDDSLQTTVITTFKWPGKKLCCDFCIEILEHYEDMFMECLMFSEESVVSCKDKLLAFIYQTEYNEC